MQARRSSLYKKSGGPPEEPVTYFHDTTSGLVNWASLSNRTPSVVGQQYVKETTTYNATHLQNEGVGICAASNTTFRADFFRSKDGAGEYPIQGFLGITVTDFYRYEAHWQNQWYMYFRLKTDYPALTNTAYIRLYGIGKSGDTSKSNIKLQLVRNIGDTAELLAEIPSFDPLTTGVVRLETDLVGDTLWIACNVASYGVLLPPTPYDVAGSHIQSGGDRIMFLSRATVSQTRARVYYPVIVNNTRELIV